MTPFPFRVNDTVHGYFKGLQSTLRTLLGKEGSVSDDTMSLWTEEKRREIFNQTKQEALERIREAG